MGIKSWLSKLIALPKSYPDKNAILAQHSDIGGIGNFNFEIVGESHYQLRIWAMMPESTADKIRAYFIAKVEPEDENPYDKKAVAVTIDRMVVGHFSRADARAYRKWLLSNNLKGAMTCRAVIVGGKNKSFGIWLDTPFDNK